MFPIGNMSRLEQQIYSNVPERVHDQPLVARWTGAYTSSSVIAPRTCTTWVPPRRCTRRPG